MFGLEADANWVSADDRHQQRAANGAGFVTDYTTELNWLATVRARAGVALGRTLVFGTGGLAVGGVKNSWTWPNNCCVLAANNDTRVGWTAGGGIEHFISNSHVTVKAEALYVNFVGTR